jgi:hypothetical protein
VCVLSRADKFVSTSALKAAAVEAAGIEIVEVTGLPHRFVPKNAAVESASRASRNAPEPSPRLTPAQPPSPKRQKTVESLPPSVKPSPEQSGRAYARMTRSHPPWHV